MTTSSTLATPAETPFRAINRELGVILGAPVIAGLDALRALAVTLVLADHYWVTDHLFKVRTSLGPLGVMIFFVLSGFLITSILLREHARTGSISIGRFYRRRAFRIFPTFYCCWILYTIVDLSAHLFSWKGALTSFFYMMDYGRAFHREDPAFWHMHISWSLAVEEKFYLLWPLLLIALLKTKRISLIRSMFFIVALMWAYRAMLLLVFGVSRWYLYCTFDSRADSLLVGCLLAILVADPRARVFCCGVLRWQGLALLPPALLLWMTFVPPAGAALFLLDSSIAPVLVAVMLLQTTYWGARSWRICRTRAVHLVAVLSYALYLYHPLGSKIIYLLHIPHNGLASAILVPLMAVASYRFIERPFMRMRDAHA